MEIMSEPLETILKMSSWILFLGLFLLCVRMRILLIFGLDTTFLNLTKKFKVPYLLLIIIILTYEAFQTIPKVVYH